MGLLECYKNRKKSIYKILLVIFFTYPILPSLIDSVPTIHPTRDILILPWIYIIAALGAYSILTNRTPILIKKILGIFILINIIFSTTIFITTYNKHNYKTNQYANKELGQYLKKNEEQYNKIFILSDKSSLDLQYFNLAFYSKYDPTKLQKEYISNEYAELGKFVWQPTSTKINHEKNNLYIYNYRITPKNNITKQIYNPNGTIAFSLVKM